MLIIIKTETEYMILLTLYVLEKLNAYNIVCLAKKKNNQVQQPRKKINRSRSTMKSLFVTGHFTISK